VTAQHAPHDDIPAHAQNAHDAHANADANANAHERARDDDATIRHAFDDVDHWVSVFDDTARAAWQMPDSVAGALLLVPGKVVVDIGAGTGYFNRAFARRVRPGGKVIAADVEPGLVAHMLRRAAAEETPEVFPLLIPTDAPRIPISADVVFVCDTYHHIDNRVAYFTTLRSALNPGAIVAIVDFKMTEIPVGPPVEHRIAPERVVEEMTAAGYALYREEAFLPYQYMLLFRVAERVGR